MIILAFLAPPRRALAQETITPLTHIQVSTSTGEKPQSKVWFHDGRWWAVLPSTSVSPSGTWLWRLEPDNRWKNVLRLSSNTAAKADIKAVGDVTHVLLHKASPQLVSVQYVPGPPQTYDFWTVRPTPTSISLPGSETATIDIDSTERMWLATESGANVLVHYSDYPYSTFQGPITLATDILEDDITVVAALPVPYPPRVGVLWSNQNTQRFGFKFHVDGSDPMMWSVDEVPAEQSALHVGAGMADDHLNVKVGSDGTLYAAVKTSYDTRSFPKVALLVRRPYGQWDDLYFVDDYGTRGIVLLNEEADFVRVAYAGESGGGDVFFRDSLLSPIAFGARGVLISGVLNDPTSSKSNWTDQTVVLASGAGVLITRPTTTTTTSTTTTTTSSTAPSTTTTTLRGCG